jgi:hypothetical protein
VVDNSLTSPHHAAKQLDSSSRSVNQENIDTQAAKQIPQTTSGRSGFRSFIILIPNNLYSQEPAAGTKRHILPFALGEALLELGVVHRIEFREKRCNLTLKNSSPKRQSVNVRVWVLNKSLIELWHQTEKWNLTSLQPDQSHVVSWEFNPAVPDVVWNLKARDVAPAWVIVDSLW